MRCSINRKFVFVSNPKCGTTSIRKALNPFSNIRSGKNKAFKNHWPARRIRKELAALGHDWNDFYSFMTIRNPWQKVASLYVYGLNTPTSVWHQPAKDSNTLDEFVSNPVFASHAMTLKFMSMDKSGTKMLVNDIIRLEDLDERQDALFERLGFKPELVKLNVSPSYKYRELYNDRAVELVREFFVSDIEFGKYEY